MYIRRRQWHPTPVLLPGKIPWAEEPGRLQSMGSRRVGHDWATLLSLFTFTFHFHALEKEMATHSNVLAWRIPGTGEPGRLPSMGSHTVRHDWSDLAAAAAGAAAAAVCTELEKCQSNYEIEYMMWCPLGNHSNPYVSPHPQLHGYTCLECQGGHFTFLLCTVLYCLCILLLQSQKVHTIPTTSFTLVN